MRRLPVVCALVLSVPALFLAVWKYPSSTFAAAQSAADTSGITSAAKVSVVATGIPVRAVATDPRDSASLYLMSASSPAQIFRISTTSPTGIAINSHLAAVAGTGATGSLGDGGLAISAQLDLNESSLLERSGIAVNPNGTLFFADTGNSTIRSVAGPATSEPGIIRSVAGRWATAQNAALVEPLGIALDQSGDLFIADHGANIIAELSTSGQFQVLAHIASPANVAVTPDGRTVFVASPETGAVFTLNPQTRAIDSLKGFPAVSNTPACGTSNPQTAGNVCPSGLAADSSGALFISDQNDGRILRVDSHSAAVTTIATGLNAPGALAMDAQGNLYVAEQGTNRILAFAQVGTSQGSLSLTPTAASYGNEPAGGVTASRSFTLSTTAAVTGLSIPKTTSPADFTVQSNSCTTSLAANSSCTLNVAFAPTTTGARSATLTVTDSTPTDSASTVLSGTGDDYQLQLANGQLTSVSTQAGASSTFNLQVVPDNVFSGTVSFVCPNNLPTNTTCAFSSPTVNVTAGTPAPFSVTFQTTGIINPITTWMPFLSGPPSTLAVALLFIVAGATLLSLRRRTPWIATAGVLLAVAVVLAGCKKATSPAMIGATPAGTYTMAVTGNSQNASRALTLTLNVVQK